MLTDLLVRLNKINKRVEDPRFYFVWHAKLFDILFALLLLGGIVWSAVFYFAATRPEALTWAQTVEGKTVPLYSVEEPQYSNQAVESWVETAIKTVYSYDFTNYDAQISQARPYFSPEAWALFTKQIEKNIIPEIQKKQMLVSIAVDKAKIGAPPRVVGGIMSWTVEVPAMISYTTASETKSEKIKLEVVVKRQVNYTNPKGLWITRLNEIR